MKKFAIIAAIIIAGAAVYALFFRVPEETWQRQDGEQVRVYQNAVYGYSVSYPSNLEAKEYIPESVSLGSYSGEIFNSVADISVITINAKPGESFIKAAADSLKNMCAADGPTTTYYCTGLSQFQPFETRSGINGYTFYLNGEIKELKTGKTTAMGKGPFFAFIADTSATASKIIAVHSPMNISAAQANSETIRSIAESLQMEDSSDPNASLNRFISENLSELSPVKEQLGGTFFVTKIEAHGGAGTVEYEDGHNAYVADFTYSVDEQGEITVQTFEIRK